MNATRAVGPWTDCHVWVAAEVLDNGLLVRLEVSLTLRDWAPDEWRCMNGTEQMTSSFGSNFQSIITHVGVGLRICECDRCERSCCCSSNLRWLQTSYEA
jgi:hypothetical protein